MLRNRPVIIAAGFLVTSLILLEVFQATGEAGDFPFLTKLPPAARHTTLTALLQRWMSHREHSAAYRCWALDIDQSVDVRAWAAGKAGQPQSLLSLARQRWQGFYHGLQAVVSSESAQRQYLVDNEQLAASEAKQLQTIAWQTVQDLKRGKLP